MSNYTNQILQPSIAQKEIIEYIDGSLPKSAAKKIRKVNEYKLLFEIIGLAGTTKGTDDSEHELPSSYSEIESLIEKILSGEASLEESRKFIAALRNSYSFYQKVMVQLKSMTPEIMNEDAPELNQVRMQTVEQTVDFIKKTLDGGERKEDIEDSIIENDAESFINKIKNIFQPVPKLAYAYSFALLFVAIISYNFYTDWNQKRIFMAHFSYNLQVPLPYTKSGLRDAGEFSEVGRFRSSFKGAIRNYRAKQYKASVLAFSKMEAQAENLISSPATVKLLLDYYLYFGLSRLALLAGNEQDLSEIEKEKNGRSTIDLLLKAKDYAGIEQDANQNINYFLGVAYWFRGEKEKALASLTNVSESNKFYENSQLLLSKMEGR